MARMSQSTALKMVCSDIDPHDHVMRCFNTGTHIHAYANQETVFNGKEGLNKLPSISKER